MGEPKQKSGVAFWATVVVAVVAFYAAITFYGVHASWRYHIGAVAVLLSTALVVALINRYVWDLYFEKKRQTPIPNFLREVVGELHEADRRCGRRTPAHLNNCRKISSELSVYFISMSGPTKFSGTPATFGTTGASIGAGGTAGSAGK